ncbi:hypothetical protein P7K49_011140 [Saguinus oedipus]|uniref:Chemokine interleukin-8-like domain-containing protein n=1 Tax=Saguinus oedipus TaxID=9490 RepID=A0ABQ9VPU0_SAGOE|nr:hypothetical protein P7K49_011140 [Saguinus oedipus]
MIPANAWLLFWKLPLGGALQLAPTPIKGQPELQRIPVEDPETASGPPTASPTGTMKVSVAALAVILVATTLCAPVSATPYASDTTPCCFAYIVRLLPRAHIKEYFYTSGKCSIPAVV